jgi:uncharacterized protein YggU (UPF0235/DUF167 family)
LRLAVLVKPGAKQQRATRQPDGSLLVWVKERAQEGEANEAVRRVVAGLHGVPKTAVKLVAGARGRRKLFELPG